MQESGMDGMSTSWKADDLTAQRLRFNLEALGSVSGYPIELGRLPKDEPVTVRFKPHQSLRIRLAKHDFVLVSGLRFLLIDDTGADLKLDVPRCVIGRGINCGAIVSNRYPEVSRKHLIVETQDDGSAVLTDISSLGSYLPTDEF